MTHILENKRLSFGRFLKYQLVPLITLTFLIISSQLLPLVGNPDQSFKIHNIFGNIFSWTFVSLLILWAVLWLLLPSKEIQGPQTPSGNRALYKTNGRMYYLATTGFLLSVSVIEPQICVSIYENMGPIVGTLNVIALALCLFLLIRGIQNDKEDSKEDKKTSIVYQFMLGVDLHPRLFGMDVKQLTSPRLGNMMWQIFIIVYLVAGWKLHGFNAGHFVNVTLQSVYIYKAFHLEDYYFTMFEMMEDHAGYNLCWGSLVWIPAFYAFQSYFFVRHPSNISNEWAAVLFCFGLLAIYLNYETCNQKRSFRKALELNTMQIKIWGRKAIGIPVQLSTFEGKQKQTQLLISGWWGMARKMNYTFELVAIIMWSLPGFQYGLWYASYFLFVFVFMIHRIKYRDEIKCSKKYGLGWDEYCKKVPYILIPYLF
ncbi:unnamed protein product [Orchesella dallaii]|uniref:7-dehydrocholesterol reductase n=1 Tax=Orchesella dallaii TaxID=48710 RepID=A0ABP1RI91_9HEXA